MTEEILISLSSQETRVAVVEQGLLQEILIERTHTRGVLGNIYKGRVTRVMPGMQSAFIDVGLPRAAFVHVSDILDTHPLISSDERSVGLRSATDVPTIQALLREGQTLTVQVMKEPIKSKGARLSTNISLASRFLVYMPGTPHIGISQRIEAEDERQRLRQIVEDLSPDESDRTDGFIIRTAAESIRSGEIEKDASLLKSLWQSIDTKAAPLTSPALVYEDLPLHLRVMRDLINRRTGRIATDSRTIYEKLGPLLEDVLPEKLSCLELTQAGTPLFDRHDIEDQISKALDKTVLLKSDGSLVIEQTEAMTTIDVNTGAYVGRKDLEETIYRTNLEAAAAIPRQLRLRNIGGIVILDFIDMVNEEHKRQVLRILEKGQLQDGAKYRTSEISELGLVEMTRKRTRESLSDMLREPCPYCKGDGWVKTPETVCLEIFREIRKTANNFREHKCLIMASQVVVDRLLEEEALCIKELAKGLQTEILYQVEATYSQQHFDIVLV